MGEIRRGEAERLLAEQVESERLLLEALERGDIEGVKRETTKQRELLVAFRELARAGG